MAHFDTVAAQKRWDALLKRQAGRGILRQYGKPDRAITVSVQETTPLERLGGMSNPLDHIAIVSGLDPDTGLQLDPPPSEMDAIIAGGETLKIVAPPDGMGADNDVALFWRIKVRA